MALLTNDEREYVMGRVDAMLGEARGTVDVGEHCCVFTWDSPEGRLGMFVSKDEVREMLPDMDAEHVPQGDDELLVLVLKDGTVYSARVTLQDYDVSDCGTN